MFEIKLTPLQEYVKQKHERDLRVLAGLEPPPICFTCKTLRRSTPATHVTDGITPAGYRAYQCDEHVPKTRRPLWGSDPGWRNDYIPLAPRKN